MTSEQQLDAVGDGVTDLVRALDRMPLPSLAKLIETMRTHEAMVERLTPEFPGVVDVLAAAPMRRALLALAEQVLVFRKENV